MVLEDACEIASTLQLNRCQGTHPRILLWAGGFSKNKYSTSSIPNFGYRANGKPVSDVDLPPWATDASDFVTELSAALESKCVSTRLNEWIDLVFGVKSGEKSQYRQIMYFITSHMMKSHWSS